MCNQCLTQQRSLLYKTETIDEEILMLHKVSRNKIYTESCSRFANSCCDINHE